jgi:hypothetical protein
MSSDYEFSDDEDYNEYDDDEEAMDVEGGLPYLSSSVVPSNLIFRPNDRFYILRGGHRHGRR